MAELTEEEAAHYIGFLSKVQPKLDSLILPHRAPLIPGSIMLVDLGLVAELTEEEAAHYIGFLRTQV